MFISIPREFFVPVVFGEGFVLNEQNNNLELDTNVYRESTENKSINKNININYLNESKSFKEKQDIMYEKIDMNESKCSNNSENSMDGKTIPNKITKPNTEENINKENTFYMALKEDKGLQKMCENYGEMFKELDDEFVENVDIKGCSEN